jgi:HAD superfamily hydrolase (TIGR01490 family)
MNLCLFDLDHTLLPIDSDHEFGKFMVSIGLADEAHYRQKNDQFYQQYVDGTLVLSEYIDFTTHVWRVLPEPEQRALQERFMREIIEPALKPQALQLVQTHAEQGDTIAIVTATNEFVTRPIADAFGVADLIAVKLGLDDQGRVNGKIDGVPSFKEGKITRVVQWLSERGQSLEDFKRVTFYSDSPNDLPLLELATDPVATNPSEALKMHALSKGWRVLNLFT